jgi:hypothetical protein
MLFSADVQPYTAVRPYAGPAVFETRHRIDAYQDIRDPLPDTVERRVSAVAMPYDGNVGILRFFSKKFLQSSPVNPAEIFADEIRISICIGRGIILDDVTEPIITTTANE